MMKTLIYCLFLIPIITFNSCSLSEDELPSDSTNTEVEIRFRNTSEYDYKKVRLEIAGETTDHGSVSRMKQLNTSHIPKHIDIAMLN